MNNKLPKTTIDCVEERSTRQDLEANVRTDSLKADRLNETICAFESNEILYLSQIAELKRDLSDAKNSHDAMCALNEQLSFKLTEISVLCQLFESTADTLPREQLRRLLSNIARLFKTESDDYSIDIPKHNQELHASMSVNGNESAKCIDSIDNIALELDECQMILETFQSDLRVRNTDSDSLNDISHISGDTKKRYFSKIWNFI